MSTLAISFLCYTVAIGLLGLASVRYSSESRADFLVADRGLGAWVAGLSSAASAESGWVTLGLVGYAFNTGIAALWVVPGTVAAFLFNWFVVSPRLRRAASECEAITLTDVIVSPYDRTTANRIRSVSIVVTLLMLVLYGAAQFSAAGKMFNATFGWSYQQSVIVGAAFVLAYTLAGGFRAIAWTDVAQASVMIATLTAVPILVIAHHGGFTACWQTLAAMDAGRDLTDVWGGKAGSALVGFLALWIGVPLGNTGQPHVLLRMMAAKDDVAARRAGVISTVWVLFLFCGAVVMGIAARVHFGVLDDPEQSLPLLAQDTTIVPSVVGGLILASVLAAICSTADSQLLVAASSISHDFLDRICNVRLDLRQAKRLDRAAVLVVGGAAVAIALLDVRSIFTFVLDYGWAGLGAGFGPVLILRLMSKRTTGAGILAGMITGVTVAIVWRAFFPEWHKLIYCLIPAFAASWLTILVVSRWTSDSAPERAS